MVGNWIESLGKINKFNKTLFSFLRKLLCRSRYEIEGKSKLSISLRWN